MRIVHYFTNFEHAGYHYLIENAIPQELLLWLRAAKHRLHNPTFIMFRIMMMRTWLSDVIIIMKLHVTQ